MNSDTYILAGRSASGFPPPLYGLVLSESLFHLDAPAGPSNAGDLAFVKHLYEWLDAHCEFVFVAAPTKPKPAESLSFPQIFHSVPFRNALGSILSAMRVGPRAAWLVVSDMLRHLNAKTIAHLIVNRNPEKWATAFINPQDDLPEGLCTIYEPAIFKPLLQVTEAGCASPQAALAQMAEHVEVLAPLDPLALTRNHLLG